MRVARAVTRQLAHCRVSALPKLSETRFWPWVLCFTLCECVSASALGRPSSGVAWLLGKGGSWARVDCAGQTDGRGLALSPPFGGDLGVLAQTGSICVCMVALTWIGVCGSSALGLFSGREPGGGREQVVLGFLLALGSASSAPGAVLEGIWGHLPSP